jgi:cytochrome oxidase Cu insertion factor (SCO1/SenC/PrrC family)
VAAEADARRRAARRTIALLALVCAAPVIASYVAYYWLHPSARVNYGELEEIPAPDIGGTTEGRQPWRLASLHGRWVLLVVSGGPCEASCERALYATRQARTMQNREQDRVVRVLLQPSDAVAPNPALLAEHPGLVVVADDPEQWRKLPGGGAGNIYLVDPVGNIVLRYSSDPDIKRLAKDLERVLKASRIG